MARTCLPLAADWCVMGGHDVRLPGGARRFGLFRSPLKPSLLTLECADPFNSRGDSKISTVNGSDGREIGGVGEIYLDDETGAPEWVTVATGLFGSSSA